jgi:hypothetical protein
MRCTKFVKHKTQISYGTYFQSKRVLAEKPEGKRPLGRPRRRWEDNIKMDLQEVGCSGMDWIGTGSGHL